MSQFEQKTNVSQTGQKLEMTETEQKSGVTN